MNPLSPYHLFKNLGKEELENAYSKSFQNSIFILKTKADYLDYIDTAVNFVKFLRVASYDAVKKVFCQISGIKYSSGLYIDREDMVLAIANSLPVRKDHPIARVKNFDSEKCLPLARKMFKKINERSARREHDKPSFSFADFCTWLYKQPTFQGIFIDWVKSGEKIGLTPSVNRIDNSLGYQLENMEILTWAENDALNLCEQQMDIRGNNDGHWYFKKPVDEDTFHLIRNEKLKKYLEYERNLIVNEFKVTSKTVLKKNISDLLLTIDIGRLNKFSTIMNCAKVFGKPKKYEVVDAILFSLPCPIIRGNSRLELEVNDKW